MSTRTENDFIVKASALYHACDKYGLDPVAAIDMMISEQIALEGAYSPRAEQLRAWAIALTNNEPWAMALSA